MKYMGSKRAMLTNGLGELLDRQISQHGRFVDLFAGSASVANHVAERYNIPVLANDLQTYSYFLASAILNRTKAVEWNPVWKRWYASAQCLVNKSDPPTPKDGRVSKKFVGMARKWCENQTELPFTSAYGGHYLSPLQSVWIDGFLETMARRGHCKSLMTAALVQAVSQCVASPGHTAQPFQPTVSSLPHLAQAWCLDLPAKVNNTASKLADRFAISRGAAAIGDANELAQHTTSTDLIFIDPPYSGVHYSRFYHVLESIAVRYRGEVGGIGRYPPPAQRPKSKYSARSHAKKTLEELLATISMNGATAILTFPHGACSNGLSGEFVRHTCDKYFRVDERIVESRFSTLGGTPGTMRESRQTTRELVLLLRPG